MNVVYEAPSRSRLTDRFGREHKYLRISVTDRCNFRCLYCMPHEGVTWKPHSEILSLEEIVRLIDIFVGMGIEKIRFTGGEPTVRKGLESLISAAVANPGVKSVHMTTNGSTLAKKAAEYRSLGLSGINISLDTLKPARFYEMTGQDSYYKVREGIDAALCASFETIKINVVVMKGFNDDEILDFVALTKHLPVEVRFIEFMPFDKNEWNKSTLVPYRKIRSMIDSRYEIVPVSSSKNAVGKVFKVPGHNGQVGFVTSMTEEFCGGCDRLRLMADGGVKSCLFFPPSINLLESVRSQVSTEIIKDQIAHAVQMKRSGHPTLSLLPQIRNAPMVSIGG